MTGGTYARLPQGPQLNDYNELIPMIRESDETEANPLTEHELRIIARIAKTFPDNSLSKGNNSPITARKICPRAGCYDQLAGINKNLDEQPIPTLAHPKQEMALSFFLSFPSLREHPCRSLPAAYQGRFFWQPVFLF